MIRPWINNFLTRVLLETVRLWQYTICPRLSDARSVPFMERYKRYSMTIFTALTDCQTEIQYLHKSNIHLMEFLRFLCSFFCWAWFVSLVTVRMMFELKLYSDLHLPVGFRTTKSNHQHNIFYNGCRFLRGKIAILWSWPFLCGTCWLYMYCDGERFVRPFPIS